MLAEGIDRMRKGEIQIKEGYDGEYGIIKVFREDEINLLKKSYLFEDKEKIKDTYKKRKISKSELDGI